MDNKELLLHVVEGSLLRIEFPSNVRSAVVALEATVMSRHERNNECVITMWLRPFFDGLCEVVFDRRDATWKMFIRRHQDLYELPIAKVIIRKKWSLSYRELDRLDL